MRPRVRSLPTLALFAAATLALTLSTLWPRSTFAEEVADWEREGEWDEDGAKFGNIVIHAELVADTTVPGGWVLVRTVENKGEEAETCQIEERVLRTETMPGARVEPPGYAVLLRGVSITLGAHEKHALGIALPASIGAQITANLQARAAIEKGRERALALGRYGDPVMQRTYLYFRIEYLKPLPPGATAAKPDNPVTHPAAMPMYFPRARLDAGGLEGQDDFL